MIDPTLSVFLRKEFRDLRSSPQVWPGYLLLPIIAIVLPTVFLALLPAASSSVAAMDADIAALFRLAGRDPALGQFPAEQRIARLIARDSATFLLLMPVILSGTSAALAIAIEKQQRTLEPILATPISTRQLLLAKLLATLVPSVVVTWLTGTLSIFAIAGTSWLRFGVTFWPTWAVVLSLLTVAPACGALAALLGMRASMRARDVQSAVQSAGLWVVPLGIAFVALLGRPALHSVLIGTAVLVLVLGVVALLFRSTMRRFDREDILTRWA